MLGKDQTLNNPEISGGSDLSKWKGWAGQHWPIGFALIPLFRIVFLSSADGEFADWQLSWRLFWLPSLYLEFAVILVALLHKMSPSSLFRQLPLIGQILLLCWLGAMTIASASAALPGHALASALNWLVHVLFAASAFHLFRIYQDDLAAIAKRFLIALAGATALVGFCIVAFVFITGINSGFDWKSSLPGYGHIRHTGYVFAPAITAGLASLAIWPHYRNRFHLVFLILNIAAMLWLGSRGPAAALVAALATAILFSGLFRKTEFWKRAGVAVGTGSFLSIVLPTPAIGWFGALQRFWSGGGEPSEISSGRTDIWLETIRLIAEQPMLGYGGMQFQQVNAAAEGFFKHPHNGILQFVFDWGVIGGTALALLIAFAVFRLVFDRRTPKELKGLGVMGASTMLIFSLVDGVLFYNFTIVMTVIFLLLPLAGIKAHQPQTDGHSDRHPRQS